MATVESRDEACADELLIGPTLEMQQADAAFRQDLPALLLSHRGQFVAYHGTEQIAIDESPFVLEERCSGLPENSWLVAYIGESEDCVDAGFGFRR
jgi:hypothetical protein